MGSGPSASGLPGVANPYKKETFNLTEAMRLEAENPDLAKALKAEAGRGKLTVNPAFQSNGTTKHGWRLP